MDINQFNRRIREVVNDSNLGGWISASNKKDYCRHLLGPLQEHDVVVSILTDVVDDLLQRRAEDKYADYHEGDGVTILERGHCIPGTIIENIADETLVVRLDKICDRGDIIADPEGREITFHRSHDHVYVHLEGRHLSRLITGRRFMDYSPEYLEKEMQNLLRKPLLAS